MSTVVHLPMFLVIALIWSGVALAAPSTYDQRQEGQLNVHARLDNVVVVLIDGLGSLRKNQPSPGSDASLANHHHQGHHNNIKDAILANHHHLHNHNSVSSLPGDTPVLLLEALAASQLDALDGLAERSSTLTQSTTDNSTGNATKPAQEIPYQPSTMTVNAVSKLDVAPIKQSASPPHSAIHASGPNSSKPSIVVTSGGKPQASNGAKPLAVIDKPQQRPSTKPVPVKTTEHHTASAKPVDAVKPPPRSSPTVSSTVTPSSAVSIASESPSSAKPSSTTTVFTAPTTQSSLSAALRRYQTRSELHHHSRQ